VINLATAKALGLTVPRRRAGSGTILSHHARKARNLHAHPLGKAGLL
jgi:hypothetical protein